jgi:PAS domain S-box-containing protein
MAEAPCLERSLSSLETGSFGLSGLLIWLGTASSMHFALGGREIWVWVPATIVSVLLNLQVFHLGKLYPDVSGGTPNYTTRLLKKYPFGACYSAIGYFLGWVSIPPMNAIVLSDLITVQLAELNISCPEVILRVVFTVLPYLLACSGIRSLSILHLFFVLPAIGFLLVFCIQGLGWLALSPASPGFLPDAKILNPTSLSIDDWAKWYFIAIYAAYAGETSSSFVAESKNSNATLRFLKISACFIPVVYIGGSWLLMRLVDTTVGDSTFLNLSAVANYFWGSSASMLVTFLIVSGVLLSSITAAANTPRVLYQLAVDDYLSPIFRVITRQGTLLPGLVFTFTLALICLVWGDISRVVMITGTSYAISIMAIHLGSWLQRGKPEAFLPWLSLSFFFVESFVVLVGGLKWNLQDLITGLLLPIAIIICDRLIYLFPKGVFSSSWWLKRDKLNFDTDKNFLASQVTGLVLFVCSSFIIAWFAKGFLDNKFTVASNNLLVLLTVTIAFICVTIASWTSLQQVGAIDDARKNAERRLIAALDTVADTILVVNESGIINQANPAAEFLFSLNKYDLLGKNLSEFIAELIESPDLWCHGEYELLSNQYIRDIEITVSQRSRGLYNEYIVILRDISERKQALKKQAELAEIATAQAQQLEATLQDLQKTQSQLIQTEKMSSLGQLVAGVAHEINNPVSFIYGNLPILNDYFHDLLKLMQIYQEQNPDIKTKVDSIDIDFLKEDLPKILDSLKVGADRIREIVLNLRNFSRLDEAEMKPVNIHEGIDSTLLILQSRLKHEGNNPEIKIIKQYGEIPNCECYVGQLNQVFMNLLSNAIDALRMSEIKIAHPQIIIKTMINQNNKITISIKDNGIGMSEEVKAKLFDPFFTTKPVGKGTGLGLSISYQIIVEKHKGYIECISAPSEGCEFVIEIPISQS